MYFSYPFFPLKITLTDPLCSAIAVSPNNQFIVSGCEDKSIKVFDVQTKKQVHHIREAHKSTPFPFLIVSHFFR